RECRRGHVVGRGPRQGRRRGAAGEPAARRRRVDGGHLHDHDHHRAAPDHPAHRRDQVVDTMIAVLAAALSLASAAPIVIDVPYVPQSDALCGAAAAAMVFRYWGDAHATAEQFETLVDPRAGGIADGLLVDAIARAGWAVEPLAGSAESVEAHLMRREPVIVLLAEAHNRFHYLVVVGRRGRDVIVHDPSWGPNRAIDIAEFD